MNIAFWFTKSLLKLFFHTCYRYRVYGTQHVYQGGAIIAPNHASFLDPPLIGASWPEETHYLARASLFRNPLFRLLLKSLNSHPVHGSAEDIASFKIICQLLDEDKKVVIFPEGSRSEDGSLQPLKAGVAMLALRTRCPIIPVYIHGSFEAWPPHWKWPKLGTEIACVFGHPIYVEDYVDLDKKQARDAITNRLQKSIEQLHLWFERGAHGDVPC